MMLKIGWQSSEAHCKQAMSCLMFQWYHGGLNVTVSDISVHFVKKREKITGKRLGGLWLGTSAVHWLVFHIIRTFSET